MSDDLENPDLCRHLACVTVIGTRPADLPLRPAGIDPRQEAGGMTATDHPVKTKKKLLPGRHRSGMHRCDCNKMKQPAAVCNEM